jgi:hypothetical protein
MKPIPLLMVSALILMVGCSEARQSPSYKSASQPFAKIENGADEASRAQETANMPAGMMGGKLKSVAEEPPPAQIAMKRAGGMMVTKPPPPEGAIERKIIRTADVNLIVQDFEVAQQELRSLISQFKDCYIAQAETTGSTGAPRRGHWKVRVSAQDLDVFREAVARLGVPEKNSVDSQDVTEEYYDLETRIKNKKVEEQRLLKHLEKSTAKLEEILAVEREISRVRGEIEQQEGRLRLLANLTALTTVTITLQEIKNYVPPQAPTFAASVSNTFSGSIDLLISCGKGLTLVAVASAPWLPILAVAGLGVWALARRQARRAPTQAQAS